jgi:hypothetical protein
MFILINMLESTHKEIIVNNVDGVGHGVAPVGDVFTSVRLRRSNSAFQPIRLVSRRNAGSNVVDGLYPFAHRYSSVARVYKINQPVYKMGSYIYKNVENEDRNTEPKMKPGGKATFWTKAQEVLSTAPKSLATLGGGFGPAPGELLRGAQYPNRTVIQNNAQTYVRDRRTNPSIYDTTQNPFPN